MSVLHIKQVNAHKSPQASYLNAQPAVKFLMNKLWTNGITV